MDNHFNPAKQHPRTIAWQQAVNAAIKRHKEGETTVVGFRLELATLRVEHNFGVLPTVNKYIAMQEAAQ